MTEESLTALNGRLVVRIGDITAQAADVIVNAASHFLVGTDGCSGAIMAAGGPELMRACAALGVCEEGNAKLTSAFRLPARHVIHAVAPIWREGSDGEETRLVSCYRRSFELAERQGCRTMAFPSLGTGGHGCPPSWAARLAMREIAGALERSPTVERVTVVCYDRETFECYRVALHLLVSGGLAADAAEQGDERDPE